MSSAIRDKLTQEMKSAMKNKQKDRLGVIRTMMAAVKQKEVDERIEIEDTHMISILDKQLKQRRESMKIYQEAGRTELADQEKFELDVIQEFLPEALSENELNSIIDDAITQTAAASMKEMGKVMAAIKPQVQGKADMGEVSKIIKSRLSS